MTKSDEARPGGAGRWVPAAAGLVVLVAAGLLWSTNIRLRGEIESLRSRTEPVVPADPPTPKTAGTGMATEEQSKKDQLELLRLRNEVRQLREQVARLPISTPATPTGANAATATPADPPVEDPRSLILVAMGGDLSALDTLARLVTSSRGLNPAERTALLANVRVAFDLLGTEAGRGNAGGLKALWQASRIGELEGFAVKALGQAAGLGNEEALRPLLDPEAYHLLRSTATSALQPAADAGSEPAIQALAVTAADPKHAPLWMMAVQGLTGAAASGNPTAIDSLAAVAASQNPAASKAAVLALEAAARNHQRRAEEALQKLGWR